MKYTKGFGVPVPWIYQKRGLYFNRISIGSEWKMSRLHYSDVKERDGVSNHRRVDCLLNRFFRRRSKKTAKLRFTGPCGGNSPVTSEFPTQRANNAEISIWWRHHGVSLFLCLGLCWTTKTSFTRGFPGANFTKIVFRCNIRSIENSVCPYRNLNQLITA